jgi:elongation factor G
MVITKLDKEHADFGTALESAQNTFSRAIIPFTLPIGKEKDFRGVVDVVHMKAYELGADGQAKEIDIPSEGRDIVDKTRERLVELVAESNDQLMEKYFEQGTLDEEDILPNINNAIAQSKLCPVFAVSSVTQVGLRALLNGLVDYAPDPAHHEAEWGKPVDAGPDAERIGRKYSDSEPFSAYCFRTVADPFAGRINIFKIISGHLQTDANAFNSTRGVMERLGALHTMQGKQLDKVSEAHAGDIVACVKLKETQTGDTLCDKQAPIIYDSVEYPEAAIAFAIEPKSRQDEEKISTALHRILEEDPALHFISVATRRQKSFCCLAQVNCTLRQWSRS